MAMCSILYTFLIQAITQQNVEKVKGCEFNFIPIVLLFSFLSLNSALLGRPSKQAFLCKVYTSCTVQIWLCH